MDLAIELLQTYGKWLYLIILVWTFIEGETIVIIAGALATDRTYGLNAELIALCALAGSFAGDQMWYYVGRRWGQGCLDRFPKLRRNSDKAFAFLRESPKLFILSFRFVYGVRNVAPFVIGMAGVPRAQFFALNLIAATLWAHVFAWGGYTLGHALADWLGSHKLLVIGGFIALATFTVLIKIDRRKKTATTSE